MWPELHWISLHGLVVTAGLMTYVVASHTLRQRRHPSAAIGWVITLVLVPYLGLPLYLLFGTRKLVRKQPVPARARSRRGSRETSQKGWCCGWAFNSERGRQAEVSLTCTALEHSGAAMHLLLRCRLRACATRLRCRGFSTDGPFIAPTPAGEVLAL